MSKNNVKIVPIIFALIFFILGTITLPHYGINWDTINHLPRGQAYLHYFLTGKKDYSDLPKYVLYWQNSEKLGYSLDQESLFRRSLYQNDAVTYESLIKRDGGHPPISDILSSVFNRVLFGKLGLVNDIDSYRVYGVLLASLTVFLISWWATKSYGLLNGLFAALALSLYPLFWSESHFNTEKDIPETFYWSFFLFCFWKGVTNKSLKWILISSVIFGFALGTKLNIFFAIPIVLAWVAFYYGKEIFCNKISLKKLIKENVKTILSLLLIPVIGLGIVIASWPYLWADVVGGIQTVLKYYQAIGVSAMSDYKLFNLLRINPFALKWITYTTPPAILIFLIVGVFVAIYNIFKKKDDVAFLFLLWFLVPIARVTLPNASIYGGVRQIMEFIPAMALLTGFGAVFLVKQFKKVMFLRKIALMLVMIPFVFIIITLIKIHPNENVYFNRLIGGLKGAKEQNFPYWGNSFGAAYRQGVSWLNENAEEESNVVLVYELMPNIPHIWLRQDLKFSNRYRGGYPKDGEYAITLTYDKTATRSYYDKYLEKLVKPVYEVRVDSVSILKVWKNSPEYEKYDLTEQYINNLKWKRGESGVRFDLGNVINLSRLELSYDETGCVEPTSVYVQISPDEKNWTRLPGVMPQASLIPSLGIQPRDGKFMFPFVGEQARYIDLSIAPTTSCLYNVGETTLFYYRDFPDEAL